MLSVTYEEKNKIIVLFYLFSNILSNISRKEILKSVRFIHLVIDNKIAMKLEINFYLNIFSLNNCKISSAYFEFTSISAYNYYSL